AVARALKPGGILVSQIETGSKAICALHADIAAMLSREAATGYYWSTLDEYCELLQQAGFFDMEVAGESPAIEMTIDQGLATAWQRFNGAAFRQAVSSGRLDEVEALTAARGAFLQQARRRIAEATLTMANGNVDPTLQAMRSFRLTYPIVICRRPPEGAARHH